MAEQTASPDAQQPTPQTIHPTGIESDAKVGLSEDKE